MILTLNQTYTLEEATRLVGIDEITLQKYAEAINGKYLGYDIHKCRLLLTLKKWWKENEIQ